MVLSAVTACLVPEARGGPFVFHGRLDAACEQASRERFDGIEIFAPSGDHIDRDHLRSLLALRNLQVAAVGTGAGMIVHGHSLSAGDADARERACQFVRDMIDFGAEFDAPAIIGSMQGGASHAGGRESAMANLADSLRQLSAHAAAGGQNLLFEPLNRYETDLVNTIADGASLCAEVGAENLKLLADLFHMNIEEARIEHAFRDHGEHIGHVHFADSNRRAVGLGHTDMAPVARSILDSGYSGFVSAEVFPRPGPTEAAVQTARSFARYFGRPSH